MKKFVSFCTAALFLAGTAVCFAADAPGAGAPAVAPPPAPALVKGEAPPPRKAAAPKVNQVGMEVPAWSVKSAEDGTMFSSDKLKGKAYGIVFVNSSCSACRGELAQLTSMKFPDDFVMLVAAVDVKIERTLKLYRDDLQVPFGIMDDSKFTLGKIFGIGFTPASVIVDKNGKLEFWGAGFTADSSEEILGAFGKYAKK